MHQKGLKTRFKGVFLWRTFYRRFVYIRRTLDPAFYILYSIKNCTNDGGKKDSFFINIHNCILPPVGVKYNHSKGKRTSPRAGKERKMFASEKWYNIELAWYEWEGFREALKKEAEEGEPWTYEASECGVDADGEKIIHIEIKCAPADLPYLNELLMESAW